MYLITCVCLVSCDNGSQSIGHQGPGAIRVQMEWPVESTASSEQSRSAIDCNAENIDKIKAVVMESTTELAQGGLWDCTLGKGTIDKIPPGEDRLVILYAYKANGEEIYRGEAANVHVLENQTVDVAITMTPVFSRSVSLVEDIQPGAASSFPDRPVKIGDQLFFVACDVNSGFELFVADDTAEGAQILKDINPLNDSLDMSGQSAPADFVELNAWLYFRANDGNGYSIWRTDGTTANTEPVAVGAGYTNPTELTVLNNRIFFAADNNVTGRELWVYDDSTEQAQLVLDILPGDANSNPHELTVVGDELYYVANDGIHGYEVWKTDANSADHSVLATDLYEGEPSSSPSDLIEVNGRLFFIAKNGPQNPPATHSDEVWMMYKDDVGLTQVQLTADMNDDASQSGSNRATNLTNINGNILAFSAYERDTGQELYLYDWRTDTAPRRLTDLNPYEACAHPANIVYMNGVIYFTAGNITGMEHLWAVSIEQSQPLKCLTAASQTHSISPRDLTMVDQTLYFSGVDESGRRKLWATDGSRTGLVVDTNEGETKFSPVNLVEFKGQLYYTAYDGVHGEEVFKLTLPN